MQRRRLVSVALASGLSLAVLWFAIASRAENESDPPTAPPAPAAPAVRSVSLDRESLREAAVSMSQYLVRKTRKSGKFAYRVNIDPRVRVRRSYNELRHAGTIYAMVDAQQRYRDDALHDAILRAAEFLKREIIAPVPGQEGMLAAWSDPEITGDDDELEAKLGGTGLALVALLSVEQMKPGTTPIEELQSLGQFLLYMQKEDGSFYSKYIPSGSGRDERFQSLYYPGEAALGLVMLYAKDGSAEWLNAAARVLKYLARTREGQMRVEADHWALLATAELLPHYEKTNREVPRPLIVSHAVQVCESILAERPDHPPGSLLHGCFTDDGRTTPTATRLEGLLAGLEVVPASGDLRDRMMAAIRDGIAFLLRARVEGTEFDGAIPRAIDAVPITHPAARGNFNDRVTEVRIDYVQHALSAILAFERLQK